MRFMLLLKASKASEAGEMPSEELIREMGVFNEGLIQSGVLVDCAGLQASAKGARVKFQGAKRTVTEGPFDPEQLVSGFWIIQVKSKAEAIEWAKRCPHPHPGEDAEIEIRQVFETEDFENAPPEVVEQEKKFRARAKRSK